MIKSKVTILDYGVGNLSSLKKAFRVFDMDADISEDPQALKTADAVVLPGVGSFEAGMRGLKVRGLVEAVKEFAEKNKPMLGICLGAQLLLGQGFEFGIFDGLNIIPGKVVRFPDLENNEKIPQIGWNAVYSANGQPWQKTILDSLDENFNAYFVHSYILVPDKKENIFGLTKYGGYEFCSAVKKGNIYGCQFHPEKSGATGLKIIENFIDII